MISRGQGTLNENILIPFIEELQIIEPVTNIKLCRDPDDDKFLSCAKDSNAIYIVSGDKDLLDIEVYEGIEIITARDFCEKWL